MHQQAITNYIKRKEKLENHSTGIGIIKYVILYRNSKNKNRNKSHYMNSVVVRRWQIIESLNLRTEKQNVCNHGPVGQQ